MYYGSNPLVETATGKSPMVVEQDLPSSVLPTLNFNVEIDLVLQQNALQLESFRQYSDLRRNTWAGQPMPVLGPGPLQVAQATDPMFNNINYWSIVEDPVRVENLVSVDVNTLPTWRATESLTLVYWTRLEQKGRIFYW
jgi:hypothetical protein